MVHDRSSMVESFVWLLPFQKEEHEREKSRLIAGLLTDKVVFFNAFPSRNRHFFVHTTRLTDCNLNENDPPNKKFAYRLFCSKIPRL